MSSTRDIEIISQIGQKITSTLNLADVISALYGYLNSVMDVSGFTIYIYNPLTRNLEARHKVDKVGHYDQILADSISIDSAGSFSVWCLKNNQEVFINDFENDYSNYLPDYYWSSINIPESEKIHSFINLPLFVNDQTIGVVSVQSFKKNSYTKQHLEIFKSLSSFIAISLNNADTHSQLLDAKEQLLQQKKIIEQKNKDITASINYASRIQQAKLPRKEEIRSVFPQSFVLYKPKDIVSGDFYFFHTTAHQSIIAAGDCTGHGVPGALMSMLVFEKLDDALTQSKNPSQILQHVNRGIKNSLHQSNDSQSTRDGMDIALCSVDTTENIIHYAGANRPIWLFRKGGSMEEIKATKSAIGGLTPDAHPFETHRIPFQPGDTFYIFTDGYADQFSARGKKLTTQRFKDILLEIQQKTMSEQEQHLGDFIETWRDGAEQTDDILLVGVRL